jgi:hypothetical protein
VKTNLAYAFDEMRKQGIVARQSYGCCPLHAGIKITGEAEELMQSGANVLGCCFYTKQDQRHKRKGRDFWLCYGPMDSQQYSVIGKSAVIVGQMVVRCLQKYRVDYVWDGDGENRILVKAASVRPIRPEELAGCKLPAEPQIRMDQMERPWWAKFSVN